MSSNKGRGWEKVYAVSVGGDKVAHGCVRVECGGCGGGRGGVFVPILAFEAKVTAHERMLMYIH